MTEKTAFQITRARLVATEIIDKLISTALDHGAPPDNFIVRNRENLINQAAPKVLEVVPVYQFLHVDEDGMFHGVNDSTESDAISSWEWPGVNVLTGEGLDGCESIKDGSEKVAGVPDHNDDDEDFDSED